MPTQCGLGLLGASGGTCHELLLVTVACNPTTVAVLNVVVVALFFYGTGVWDDLGLVTDATGSFITDPSMCVEAIIEACCIMAIGATSFLRFDAQVVR